MRDLGFVGGGAEVTLLFRDPFAKICSRVLTCLAASTIQIASITRLIPFRLFWVVLNQVNIYRV